MGIFTFAKNQIEEIKKRTFLDPTYDSVFKEIFSVDQTLIHFLNSILHLQNGEKAGLNSLQKVALRMLEKNEPISKICEYSGLTEADILALKK